MNDRPTGQRFSLTYLNRDDPIHDSKTMRFRLAKLIEDKKYQPQKRRDGYVRNQSTYKADFSVYQSLVEAEIGVQFKTNVNGTLFTSWPLYLNKLSAIKLLDVITVLHRAMVTAGRNNDFLQQVSRIFREENIAYEVDAEGGVHPVIDGAFAATKQAAISGLSGERYAVSRARIEEIDSHLMGASPNFVQAIRSVFGANENLFKLMFEVPRLDKKTLLGKVGPPLQSLYEGHPTMQRSSAKILQSFSEWVEAAHHYRHEEGSAEPSQPAEELAVVLISEGMVFVRWLAVIDKKIQTT